MAFFYVIAVFDQHFGQCARHFGRYRYVLFCIYPALQVNEVAEKLGLQFGQGYGMDVFYTAFRVAHLFFQLIDLGFQIGFLLFKCSQLGGFVFGLTTATGGKQDCQQGQRRESDEGTMFH